MNRFIFLLGSMVLFCFPCVAVTEGDLTGASTFCNKLLQGDDFALAHKAFAEDSKRFYEKATFDGKITVLVDVHNQGLHMIEVNSDGPIESFFETHPLNCNIGMEEISCSSVRIVRIEPDSNNSNEVFVLFNLKEDLSPKPQQFVQKFDLINKKMLKPSFHFDQYAETAISFEPNYYSVVLSTKLPDHSDQFTLSSFGFTEGSSHVEILNIKPDQHEFSIFPLMISSSHKFIYMSNKTVYEYDLHLKMVTRSVDIPSGTESAYTVKNISFSDQKIEMVTSNAKYTLNLNTFTYNGAEAIEHRKAGWVYLTSASTADRDVYTELPPDIDIYGKNEIGAFKYIVYKKTQDPTIPLVLERTIIVPQAKTEVPYISDVFRYMVPIYQDGKILPNQYVHLQHISRAGPTSLRDVTLHVIDASGETVTVTQLGPTVSADTSPFSGENYSLTSPFMENDPFTLMVGRDEASMIAMWSKDHTTLTVYLGDWSHYDSMVKRFVFSASP